MNFKVAGASASIPSIAGVSPGSAQKITQTIQLTTNDSDSKPLMRPMLNHINLHDPPPMISNSNMHQPPSRRFSLDTPGKLTNRIFGGSAHKPRDSSDSKQQPIFQQQQPLLSQQLQGNSQAIPPLPFPYSNNPFNAIPTYSQQSQLSSSIPSSQQQQSASSQWQQSPSIQRQSLLVNRQRILSAASNLPQQQQYASVGLSPSNNMFLNQQSQQQQQQQQQQYSSVQSKGISSSSSSSHMNNGSNNPNIPQIIHCSNFEEKHLAQFQSTPSANGAISTTFAAASASTRPLTKRNSIDLIGSAINHSNNNNNHSTLQQHPQQTDMNQVIYPPRILNNAPTSEGMPTQQHGSNTHIKATTAVTTTIKQSNNNNSTNNIHENILSKLFGNISIQSQSQPGNIQSFPVSSPIATASSQQPQLQQQSQQQQQLQQQQVTSSQQQQQSHEVESYQYLPFNVNKVNDYYLKSRSYSRVRPNYSRCPQQQANFDGPSASNSSSSSSSCSASVLSSAVVAAATDRSKKQQQQQSIHIFAQDNTTNSTLNSNRNSNSMQVLHQPLKILLQADKKIFASSQQSQTQSAISMATINATSTPAQLISPTSATKKRNLESPSNNQHQIISARLHSQLQQSQQQQNQQQQQQYASQSHQLQMQLQQYTQNQQQQQSGQQPRFMNRMKPQQLHSQQPFTNIASRMNAQSSTINERPFEENATSRPVTSRIDEKENYRSIDTMKSCTSANPPSMRVKPSLKDDEFNSISSIASVHAATNAVATPSNETEEQYQMNLYNVSCTNNNNINNNNNYQSTSAYASSRQQKQTSQYQQQSHIKQQQLQQQQSSSCQSAAPTTASTCQQQPQQQQVQQQQQQQPLLGFPSEISTGQSLSNRKDFATVSMKMQGNDMHFMESYTERIPQSNLSSQCSMREQYNEDFKTNRIPISHMGTARAELVTEPNCDSTSTVICPPKITQFVENDSAVQQQQQQQQQQPVSVLHKLDSLSNKLRGLLKDDDELDYDQKNNNNCEDIVATSQRTHRSNRSSNSAGFVGDEDIFERGGDINLCYESMEDIISAACRTPAPNGINECLLESTATRGFFPPNCTEAAFIANAKQESSDFVVFDSQIGIQYQRMQDQQQQFQQLQQQKIIQAQSTAQVFLEKSFDLDGITKISKNAADSSFNCSDLLQLSLSNIGTNSAMNNHHQNHNFNSQNIAHSMQHQQQLSSTNRTTSPFSKQQQQQSVQPHQFSQPGIIQQQKQFLPTLPIAREVETDSNRRDSHSKRKGQYFESDVRSRGNRQLEIFTFNSCASQHTPWSPQRSIESNISLENAVCSSNPQRQQQEQQEVELQQQQEQEQNFQNDNNLQPHETQSDVEYDEVIGGVPIQYHHNNNNKEIPQEQQDQMKNKKKSEQSEQREFPETEVEVDYCSARIVEDFAEKLYDLLNIERSIIQLKTGLNTKMRELDSMLPLTRTEELLSKYCDKINRQFGLEFTQIDAQRVFANDRQKKYDTVSREQVLDVLLSTSSPVVSSSTGINPNKLYSGISSSSASNLFPNGSGCTSQQQQSDMSETTRRITRNILRETLKAEDQADALRIRFKSCKTKLFEILQETQIAPVRNNYLSTMNSNINNNDLSEPVLQCVEIKRFLLDNGYHVRDHEMMLLIYRLNRPNTNRILKSHFLQ